MQITNNYNLPEQIVNAVTFSSRAPQDNVISVTELIGPSWIRHLRRQHWSELTEDASERLWALLGQSVHYVTEKHSLPESFAEERLSIDFDGFTITGQSDNYRADTRTVEDWKITSVWSFLNGVKAEWEAQLNIYAHLWRKNGFDVDALSINAILRDWQAGKAYRKVEYNDDGSIKTTDSTYNGNGYPPIPFVVVPVDVWPTEKIEAFIRGRIAAHTAPSECTPDEKWQKSDVYAVMKPGRKSAVKLHDSETIAMQHAADLGGGHHVVKRPGECTRCKTYCPVRAFCEYNIHRGDKE